MIKVKDKCAQWRSHFAKQEEGYQANQTDNAAVSPGTPEVEHDPASRKATIAEDKESSWADPQEGRFSAKDDPDLSGKLRAINSSSRGSSLHLARSN